MKIKSWLGLILSAFLLAACGIPVPQDKSEYVGEWRADNMYLSIAQDGKVSYKRKNGNSSVSVDAPIKKFDGDNFEVGVGPFTTVFVVKQPPRQDNGHWKMVVDDVELVREDNEISL